tara:strand:- start:1550 stop:1798 length:249 start_codon:yes stop_codon:yes gene_type:complete
MNNRMYVIISVDDIQYINFNDVMQTSPYSMRRSLDGTKTFVKYTGDQPDCLFAVAGNAVGLPEYTQEEFLEILDGPEWNHRG